MLTDIIRRLTDSERTRVIPGTHIELLFITVIQERGLGAMLDINLTKVLPEHVMEDNADVLKIIVTDTVGNQTQ